MQLCEKYRPRRWDDLVGQPKAVKTMRRLLARPDWAGDAWWIIGPSGTGKTTAARIAAAQVADPSDIYELDGQACTVDAVREAADLMAYTTMSGRCRCWIVNEAQAMTAKAVQAWLTTLDPVQPRTFVLFTTTADSADLFGDYDAPFMSRCKLISFTNQGLAEPFAARAREIADLENLNGQPPAAYVRLVRRCKNNMRAVLNAIEAGEMLKE